MPCLINLSLNVYNNSTLATISSAPATLEHIFLHLSFRFSPSSLEREPWEALDAVMADMPCLRRITIISSGSAYLRFVEQQLSVCKSKGLVEVKVTRVRGWSRVAFADYDVGDMEDRLRTSTSRDETI